MTDNPQALMSVSLGLILGSVLIITLFIIFVHTMPGKIAKKRGNPQTEAIEILSLLGLLIFPLWMAALVWAYMRPFSLPVHVEVDEQSSSDGDNPEPVPSGATSDPVLPGVTPVGKAGV
jgi:hypothetical protein